MDADFWHRKWANNDIGFHESAANHRGCGFAGRGIESVGEYGSLHPAVVSTGITKGKNKMLGAVRSLPTRNGAKIVKEDGLQ